MTVQYKVFRSNLASWDQLFQQAAEFASQLGPDRVINISQSCASTDGIVTVWYWADR